MESDLVTGLHRVQRAQSVHNIAGKTREKSRSTESETGFVCVIDDDTSIRESLVDLLQSVGFDARGFETAAEILSKDFLKFANCFIVDIRMPGVSGLDFQAHLKESKIQVPIVFVTGHADVPMTVQAMKAGAIDFLTKPFREQEVLDAVARAVALNNERIKCYLQISGAIARYETLSAREREVMALVTAGLMNKQAAAKIDIAISTVKTHRTQIMKKMGARSLADLVRMAELLQLKSPQEK